MHFEHAVVDSTEFGPVGVPAGHAAEEPRRPCAIALCGEGRVPIEPQASAEPSITRTLCTVESPPTRTPCRCGRPVPIHRLVRSPCLSLTGIDSLAACITWSAPVNSERAGCRAGASAMPSAVACWHSLKGCIRSSFAVRIPGTRQLRSSSRTKRGSRESPS